MERSKRVAAETAQEQATRLTTERIKSQIPNPKSLSVCCPKEQPKKEVRPGYYFVGSLWRRQKGFSRGDERIVGWDVDDGEERVLCGLTKS